MAEANIALRASYDAWSALLWPESVNVAPLDTSAAVEIGHWHPDRYAGTAVPVLVL